MGHIPESDLQRTFDHAFAEHTSNFPISAYDLKSAYEQIVEMERAETHKRQIEQAIAEGKLYASDNYREPNCCLGSGFRYVDDPKGSHYRGVVRCDRCNYWSRRDANRPEPRKL